MLASYSHTHTHKIKAICNVYDCIKALSSVKKYISNIWESLPISILLLRKSLMFQFTKERKGKAYENPEIVRMSAKMNDNKSNKSDFASV